MKIVTLKKGLWGIAMTEYLIILAVVAVAAILIVGLFGQQIKNVFSENTAALAGSSMGSTAVGSTASTSQGNDKQDNMGSFENNAAKSSS
jgi:pilus assembly protein Flp/PilA